MARFRKKASAQDRRTDHDGAADRRPVHAAAELIYAARACSTQPDLRVDLVRHRVPAVPHSDVDSALPLSLAVVIASVSLGVSPRRRGQGHAVVPRLRYHDAGGHFDEGQVLLASAELSTWLRREPADRPAVGRVAAGVPVPSSWTRGADRRRASRHWCPHRRVDDAVGSSMIITLLARDQATRYRRSSRATRFCSADQGRRRLLLRYWLQEAVDVLQLRTAPGLVGQHVLLATFSSAAVELLRRPGPARARMSASSRSSSSAGARP